jgi:hypothetical protein
LIIITISARTAAERLAVEGGGSMKKNEDRKIAEELFLQERGRITNKEVAHRLGIHPATIARWKKLDQWDLKLAQTQGRPGETGMSQDRGSYATDLIHISLLNERIDTYLTKKELLPSEILELAEAKFHIMSCLKMARDREELDELF